jgi:hypothetical protein
LEGGDSSFTAFQNFVEYNGESISTWVRNGGRLLIISAPNDPLTSATLYLPDTSSWVQTQRLTISPVISLHTVILRVTGLQPITGP